MAKVVVMPKLGYTQDEGTIAEWHKQVGDPVAIGDPFFDVHTCLLYTSDAADD